MAYQFDSPRLLPEIRTRKNTKLTTEAILKSGLFCLSGRFDSSGWFRLTKNQTDQTNETNGLPMEGVPRSRATGPQYHRLFSSAERSHRIPDMEYHGDRSDFRTPARSGREARHASQICWIAHSQSRRCRSRRP